MPLPTYQKIFNDTTLAATMTPTIDQGLPAPVTGKLTPLGNLSEGQGVPLSDSKLTPTVNGLEVEVSHTRSDAASPTPGIASKTLYLVSLPEFHGPNQPPKKFSSSFNQVPDIVAVVEFDLPNSHLFGTSKTSTNRWAVSVNVKNGDAQDLGPTIDHPIGPACIFTDGGLVQLAPSGGNLPTPTKYKSFIGPPSTLFRLQVHINRRANSGTADSILTVGNYPPLSGSFLCPDLTSAALDPRSVSAIGIVVVNAGQLNPDSTVTVRLKSFSIWIS